MKKWMWILGLTVFAITSSNAAESIPTDFKAAYVSIEELEKNLAASGLKVLGQHSIAGNANYTSIIYTSADLKKLGQKSGRGFVSVMRILHNAEKQELVASNPEYFIRAFYQKEYQDGMEVPVMKALEAALGKMEPTEDGLTAKKLSKYKFMMAMPKYDGFQRVGKGSTQELLKKLEANAKDRVVFKLDLKGDGSSVLCGVALPVEVEKFNETIETMGQSHLLPYTVLIENGEANILHAKFYLAVSFPRLTMVKFGKIMMTPGKIKDSFKADFE